MPSNQIVTTAATPVTYSFIELRGTVQRTGPKSNEFTRPGIDGHGYQQHGGRAKETVLVSTETLSNGTTLNARIAAYQALRSDLVDVNDAYGKNFQDLIVLEVDVLQARKIEVGAGLSAADDTFHLEMRWTLRVTQ